MSGRSRIRVVVTGVGVVSPIGIGNDTFWDSLVHSRSGIDFLQSMPSEGCLRHLVLKFAILILPTIFATRNS